MLLILLSSYCFLRRIYSLQKITTKLCLRGSKFNFKFASVVLQLVYPSELSYTLILYINRDYIL